MLPFTVVYQEKSRLNLSSFILREGFRATPTFYLVPCKIGTVYKIGPGIPGFFLIIEQCKYNIIISKSCHCPINIRNHSQKKLLK